VIATAELGGSCISVTAAATVLIRGFALHDCGAGLEALGAGKIAVMSGTTFVNNTRAVQCTGATCRIFGATITGGDFGMRCESGANCELTQSTVSNTAFQGIGAIGGADLLVDGTTVTLAGANAIMSQDANLTLVQSTITASGGTGTVPAVLCNGGTCSIRRSRVTGNAGAGISIAGVSDFAVENNAVLENGSTTAGLAQNGGVVVAASSSTATQIFAHNTIFGNRAGAGEVAGVRCGMTTTTIANSIIWGNDGADVTFGGCYVIDSDVEDTAISGERNISQDPLFTSITPGMVDIHLTSGSPCVDAVPPMTGVDDDIDGDSRPSGTNADMGADEMP
jgi:hypothetical protein